MFNEEVVRNGIFLCDSSTSWQCSSVVEHTLREGGFSRTVIAKKGNVFDVLRVVHFHNSKDLEGVEMLQKQNVTTIRIMKTKNDRLCFSGKGVVSTRNSFHMENDISSCQIERNLQTVFEMANFSLEKSSSSSISVIFAILYDASQNCLIGLFKKSYRTILILL